MADVTRAMADSGSTDGEPMVNPYSLLEAVNDSSDSAHVGWLIFIGLMAYLMIAVAGVTHKDLLLETPVALPIMQVSIPQAQFFQFAPVVLVLLHIGLVSQLVLVARKALEFDASVSLLEAGPRRTHPLRLELHNFFFVQAIAGPHRSAVLSSFLHSMSWLSLVVFPVVLLLFIQLRYLPFHDVTVTWSHRIALVVDMAMLSLIGVFLARSEASFFRAFSLNTSQRPVTAAITSTLLFVVAFFSFIIVTVPGEGLDVFSRRFMPQQEPQPDRLGRLHPGGFAIPGLSRPTDGTLFGAFHRNLYAPDLDLVTNKDRAPDETSISLRGRDLRFARLDRTDLHMADLTRAQLDGASLNNTNLRGIKMACTEIGPVILKDDRVAGGCAQAPGASFDAAELTDAKFAGIDLRGATFTGATMNGAELTLTLLSGATFSNARLERADFTGGVQLHGADFTGANLRGADFSGAQLQGAILSNTQLQGATFRFAHLQGADLTIAELEGADFSATRLEGAKLPGAKARAADFRGAALWVTQPPDDPWPLADVSELRIRPLDEADVPALRAAIERMPTQRGKDRVGDALTLIMGVAASRSWSSSPDAQKWQAIVTRAQPTLSETYGRDLTDALRQMVCKPRWSTGAVATGIARRALAGHFRGLPAPIFERLQAQDCPASKTVPPRLIQEFATALDLASSN